VPYTLHILTHGRFYIEEYADLTSAVDAAYALENEPRERAAWICEDGAVCCDRQALEALFRARSAQ
jgi:hypothetical protein